MDPSRWIARQIWGFLLWFMRRPPVKRLRFGYTKWLPENKRAKAWEDFRRQEKFARKYGVIILTWSVRIALLIVLLQVIGVLVLEMQAHEWLPGT